ncbi:hypothetical protein [Shinella sumterensis]|uniref:hypothetical protein n=1 Tax=Shinella sumterensis TaxID=1967501 RepID=UPI003F87ECB5
MTSTKRLLWLQRALAKGFHVAAPLEQSPVWEEIKKAGRVTGGRERLAVLLPTIAQRLDPQTLRRISENVGAEVAILSEGGTEVAVYIVVQYMSDTMHHLAEQRRSELAAMLFSNAGQGDTTVSVHSATMRGPGKVLSLNAMLLRASEFAPGAAVLLDDDVEMESACLAALLACYREMDLPAAVGATKVGHSAEGRASKFLYWAKSHTAPATQYPHACCMLVSMSVIQNGFPTELSSDDGFICFELLDPHADDPLHRLKLEPRARVHHVIGGDGNAMYQRIRRMLLNHYQFLCAYEWTKGRFYCRDLLFFGFWPVGKSVSTGTFRSRAIRWWVKAAYFTWFTSIGIELAVRAITRRPIRAIPWGSGTTVVASTPATQEIA